jgi:hypothetical protein
VLQQKIKKLKKDMTRANERDGAKQPSIPIPLQDPLILSDLDLTVDDFSKSMRQIPLPQLELVMGLPLEKLLVLQIFCAAGLCCSTEGLEHLSVILDDHIQNEIKKMGQFQLFAILPVIYALIKFRAETN